MDAVLLLVGDELLSGHTRDANGHHVASRLAAAGHRLLRILVLPDDEDVIVHELTRSISLAPIVVVSGGLGPTHDDRTTAAVARFARAPLVVDEAALAAIRAKYRDAAAAGRRPSDEVTPASRKMATVPAGAIPLSNAAGHAVGYALDVGEEGKVVVLPGVPAECRAVWEEAEKILPAGEAEPVVEVDVLLPESLFADALEAVQRAHPAVLCGSYPRAGEPRVKVRFRGEGATAAAEDLARRLPGKVSAR